MSSLLTQTASAKCYGGQVKTFKHASAKTNTDMVFSVFFPKECQEQGQVPVIFYLSGLTCTDQNALTKGGFQEHCARRGVCMVFPDTSPRGHSPIEGEAESWDFGLGAGFYVTATEPKFKSNYNMYEYVVDELPALLAKEFPKELDLTRKSIMGHSMGGHGALISALKNPGQYQSVSAFAPICHPSICPWGTKAFTNYLGGDVSQWAKWDASQLALVYSGKKLSMLVDQGSEDSFLHSKQLLPDTLVGSAKQNTNLTLRMRMQPGYDHSYYFMQTFAQEHVDFHCDFLFGKGAL
ncbi:S-formylglutathione hydrolase [Batrachochytrium salamandrivorans]|nr:S-formylglutathione hydrolase [Batrachochytrium salamandrivorans]